jgi:HEAT repeat protein
MTANAIERAKAHLEDGEAEEARDLLLAEGYVRREDADIQRAYAKLLRPSGVLATKITEVTAAVSDPSAEARYKALSALAREVFKETSLHIKAWVADPRVTGLLIGALDDEDPRVVEKAAAILSVVVSRYFADLRAFEPLVALLESKRKQTRLYAVFSIPYLARPDRWDVLLPAFEDAAPEVRQTAVRGVLSDEALDELPAGTRTALADALRPFVKDKDPATKVMAERALARLKS